MPNNIGISLGSRCSSTIWAVEHNFRKRRSSGYNTCPFDLCVTNYKGIVECIRDDFRYLTDISYIKIADPSEFPNIVVHHTRHGEHLIYNTKYNFCFNHESPYYQDLYKKEEWINGPNHFVNNDCSLFIERYMKRIHSFREYMADKENHINFIFLFDSGENPNNECLELRNVLKERYPELSYSIVIIIP